MNAAAGDTGQPTARHDDSSQVALSERVRVLLADDDERFLATVSQILQPTCQVIRTVSNGQALVDEAVELDPDVIVLDISMPFLNGLEAARQLRAKGSQSKVVFLTVHGDEDYVRAALATGALGYVVKPRLATDLERAIREVLAGRSFVSPIGTKPTRSAVENTTQG